MSCFSELAEAFFQAQHAQQEKASVANNLLLWLRTRSLPSHFGTSDDNTFRFVRPGATETEPYPFVPTDTGFTTSLLIDLRTCVCRFDLSLRDITREGMRVSVEGDDVSAWVGNVPDRDKFTAWCRRLLELGRGYISRHPELLGEHGQRPTLHVGFNR